ncbi:hypothetical protein EHS25_005744 [Saitozyma podzolica]|uniref:Uncharacterized protein n=1 Tax=Saitozyma podzolica TaxID=1890683 RepID=A0A427XW03_9TREE|nr:hypothetical protein EHS25_005744 [Saitozyma podzolica]
MHTQSKGASGAYNALQGCTKPDIVCWLELLQLWRTLRHGISGIIGPQNIETLVEDTILTVSHEPRGRRQGSIPNGVYTNPAYVIFGSADYDALREVRRRQRTEIYRLELSMQYALHQCHVLFIGCNGTLSDPHFTQLFEFIELMDLPTGCRQVLLCTDEDFVLQVATKKAPNSVSLAPYGDFTSLGAAIKRLVPDEFGTENGRNVARVEALCDIYTDEFLGRILETLARLKCATIQDDYRREDNALTKTARSGKPKLTLLRPNPAGAGRYGGDHSFSTEEVNEVIRCLRGRPAFQHVVICVEVHRPKPDCIASVVELPNCVRFLRTKEEMDAFYIEVEAHANDINSTNAGNTDFHGVAFEIKTIEEFQRTLIEEEQRAFFSSHLQYDTKAHGPWHYLPMPSRLDQPR